MDTSVDLHKISLQGTLERNWEQEHAIYIDQWAHRGELLANAPTLDEDMSYLTDYMELYPRMTKRYITRESAYWEILARQQFDASFMD